MRSEGLHFTRTTKDQGFWDTSPDASVAAGTFLRRALAIAFINAAIFGMPMTLRTAYVDGEKPHASLEAVWAFAGPPRTLLGEQDYDPPISALTCSRANKSARPRRSIVRPFNFI